jgi:putative endopeptidase
MKITKSWALGLSVSMLALSTPAMAENVAPPQEAETAAKSGPQLGTYGFDSEGMDTSVSPADDFYLYANGKWAEKTQIPADKSNYGMFTALDDLSKDRVKLVLEAEKDVKGS